MEFKKLYPCNSNKELVKMFGRSINSIRHKAFELKLRKCFKFQAGHILKGKKKPSSQKIRLYDTLILKNNKYKLLLLSICKIKDGLINGIPLSKFVEEYNVTQKMIKNFLLIYCNFKYKDKRKWLSSELKIIRDNFDKMEIHELQKLLPNRSISAIYHMGEKMRIKRIDDFRFLPIKKLNRYNNPAKRPEVRAMKKRMMKEYILKHPEKHPNMFLRRNHITSLEKKMKEILSELGFYENKDYLYNYYFKVKDGYLFPDFRFIDINLIIEVDGSYWHKDIEAEKIRDKRLNEVGYKVIHFSDKELKNVEDVKRCILQELNLLKE